jgi:regulator of replication initiation timing
MNDQSDILTDIMEDNFYVEQIADLTYQLEMMTQLYNRSFNEASNLNKENEQLKKDLAQHDRLNKSQNELINGILELCNNC